MESYEYRWASEVCSNSLPHPDELEYLGYDKVGRHRLFPSSILYRRALPLHLSSSERPRGVHIEASLDLFEGGPVDKGVGCGSEKEARLEEEDWPL